MTGRLAAFGRFWWDFVVGDDPLIAVVVLLALVVTGLLNHAGLAGWWLLPVGVVAALALSMWRVVRHRARAGGPG
jgi:hypothetical protein